MKSDFWPGYVETGQEGIASNWKRGDVEGNESGFQKQRVQSYFAVSQQLSNSIYIYSWNQTWLI